MKLTYNYDNYLVCSFEEFFDDAQASSVISCMMYDISLQTHFKATKTMMLHYLLLGLFHVCKKYKLVIYIQEDLQFEDDAIQRAYTECLKDVKRFFKLPTVSGKGSVEDFVAAINNKDVFQCCALETSLSANDVNKFKPSTIRDRIVKMNSAGLKEIAKACGEDVDLKYALQY